MLEIQNITKRYRNGSQSFAAIDDVSFKVENGDSLSVIGHSGSGKSTLLNAIGGLIHPDEGKVLFEGKDIYSLSQKQLDEFRKIRIGFVFQQFHLIPYLTVSENISMSCREKSQSEKIGLYLEQCSLSEQKNKYPSELSVGEKQRTAFIRAIISQPELLLADEPTGNLDPANSRILLKMISDFHKAGGTVILVSHDPAVSEFATKTITLEKGRIKML
jgi:putative ABC transport system ATP-binding protein